MKRHACVFLAPINFLPHPTKFLSPAQGVQAQIVGGTSQSLLNTTNQPSSNIPLVAEQIEENHIIVFLSGTKA